MKKTGLSSTVALAALICAAPGAAFAQASTTELRPAATQAADANAPTWGDLDPFWGDLDPFWGDLDPFWGDLDPFWGDLDPFWGDLEGFWGDLEGFAGDARVQWGDLEGFWGDLEGFWGDLEGFWDPRDDRTYTDEEIREIVDRFRAMSGEAEAVFGDAIREAHDAGFDEAFLNPLLDRYGLAPDELHRLAELTPGQRAQFFLAFYDGLMDHSGRDRVDWWMGAVRWTPSLTQDQTGRYRAKVGLLDSVVPRGTQTGDRIRYRGGYAMTEDDIAQGHGTAVASLIAAPHDGTGIMGLAPNAKLFNYNPYDETGTANFGDVAWGILNLRARGAHVINASLGVPGEVLDQRWARILSYVNAGDDAVIVKAAGNSGVEGTDTFWWNPQGHESLLVVGSVGVSGRISSFSNRPGTACLRSWRGCGEGDLLMDRFLVAPGELILTDDGQGGQVRRSGTSFAAPLVTGTVALLHSRWPWLEQHAETTANIILDTATDLGAPGVDEVYGHGLLDVEAANSPLDFAELYQVRGRGQNRRRVSLGDSLLSQGGLERLTRRGVLIAYEDVGDTFRDFAIPLSDRQMDRRSRVVGGRKNNQSFLADQFTDWVAGAGFADTASGTVETGRMTLSYTSRLTSDGQTLGEARYLYPNGAQLTFGSGAGLPTSLLFDSTRDQDSRTTGAAGLLGLAQGGAYVGASVPAGDLGRLSVAAVRSGDDAGRFGFDDDPITGSLARDPYASMGAAVALTRPVGEATLNLSYQHLHEANGVLGTQGTGVLSLGDGAATKALSAELLLPAHRGVTVAFGATAGRTSGGDQDGLIRVGSEGLVSTAFLARASMDGVALRGDRATLSLTQPLTVTGGALLIEGEEVVDRETGERAAVSQRVTPGGALPLIAQADYAVPVLRGRATLSGLVAHDAGVDESQVGVAFRTRF